MPLRTVHCGPCWAEFGGSPSAEEIAAPPLEGLGSRDPRDQREWPERLAAEDWVQQLRRDCRDRLLRLVRELTLRASWTTWESWPGWERLQEVSGWARSTVAGWIRQLRLTGWLASIETGSTPQYRPMALADIVGNRRAVYALRVPRRPGERRGEDGHQAGTQEPPQAETVMPGSDLERRVEARAQAAWRWFATGFGTRPDQEEQRTVDKTWTPTWFFNLSSRVDLWVSSRARDFFHSSHLDSLPESRMEALRARSDAQPGWTFAGRVPTSDAQMLAAAAELRHQHPVLALLTIRAVRALCRPYWRAQWTNRDALHALEYRPTSWSTLPAMDPARVLAPYRWAQSRLSAWRTDTGRVLPGHTEAEQDQRAREHAVVAQFGKAALAALPAGASRLSTADVRRFGRSRVKAAAEVLRRRRTAELADALAAKTRPELAAAPETAARVSAEIRAERERRQAAVRERLLEQARAAAAERVEQDQAQPKVTWTPPGPGETPKDRYELARARARHEGHLPLSWRCRRPHR